MPGRNRSSGMPLRILGVRKRPARATFAAGSPLLMPALNTRRSRTYCFALGFRYQKLGEFTSFQSCHQITGSFGMVGCVVQKVPLLPYRAAASRTKLCKSPKRCFEGGKLSRFAAQEGEL